MKFPPEVERKLRDESRRFGEPLHPEIAKAPVIRLGLALYLNAFFDLDFERDWTEYQPIKRSDCFAYARDYDLDDEQREDLWYYVARMDRDYLKYRSDTAPKETRKGKRGD